MKKYTLFLVFVTNQLLIGGDGGRLEIPFRLDGHRVIVSGSVGGLEGLALMIDTGATFTHVSPRIAHKLGLRCGNSTRTRTPSGVRNTCPVVLDQVRVGPMLFEAVEARADKIPSSGKVRIDGLIGLNLLKQLNIIIDFEVKRLIVNSQHSFEESQAFSTNLPYIAARLEIAGTRAVLLLDTGAEDLLLFRGKDFPSRRCSDRKRLGHVGGKITVRCRMLSNVSLGGTVWDQVLAFQATISSQAYDGLDGILGARALGLKRLQLDFPNGRWGWER